MKMLRTIFFPALVFMMMLSTAVQTRLNLDASAGMVNLAQQNTGRKTKMDCGISKLMAEHQFLKAVRLCLPSNCPLIYNCQTSQP